MTRPRGVFSKKGRPIGFKESEETKEKKAAAMRDRWAQKRQPTPEWSDSVRVWGDDLDFLSPEQKHLATGGPSILPAKPREKRT